MLLFRPLARLPVKPITNEQTNRQGRREWGQGGHVPPPEIPKLKICRGFWLTYYCILLQLLLAYTLIQGGPKNLAPFILYALTLSIINRLSKLFHCQNQENICNNTVTNDPTTPQVCRYTTLWNVSVIKATIENKTTSVTTYFKKSTTGNKEFVVSVFV